MFRKVNGVYEYGYLDSNDEFVTVKSFATREERARWFAHVWYKNN